MLSHRHTTTAVALTAVALLAAACSQDDTPASTASAAPTSAAADQPAPTTEAGQLSAKLTQLLGNQEPIGSGTGPLMASFSNTVPEHPKKGTVKFSFMCSGLGSVELHYGTKGKLSKAENFACGDNVFEQSVKVSADSQLTFNATSPTGGSTGAYAYAWVQQK